MIKNKDNLFNRIFAGGKESKPEDGSMLPAEVVDLHEGNSALAKSLVFLQQVVHARLKQHFGKTDIFIQPDFSFPDDKSVFARYVIDNKLSIEEYILVLLALAPHIHPDLFSDLIKINIPKGGDFPEFGGVRGQNYRGIMPTGETALFVLAGMNFDHRFKLIHWFKSEDCFPFFSKILSFEPSNEWEPEMSGKLLMSPEKVTEFITGDHWRPAYSSQFPASLLTTKMDWEELILSPSTMSQLNRIQNWKNKQPMLIKDAKLGTKIKSGLLVLFHGPPGTGKTLAAALLGKKFKMDVYRIDLSMIVSKYIGETEKNLQFIIDKATRKNWILFFDEADSLFGKRTNVQSSHDRYANQDVSYLLQKVEEHDGMIILATNFKSNLDPAFMRRIQIEVAFSLPNAIERKRIWENALPVYPQLDPDVNITELAKKYEISGASIVNVLQMSALRALDENRSITEADLLDGLSGEFAKEGRTL
jgi:hypothetical protein